MILFDLRCKQGHAFEAWFRDGATYEEQARAGVIACAICGDTDVSKALMAPALATRARRGEVEGDTGAAHRGAGASAEKGADAPSQGGDPTSASTSQPARPRVDAAQMAKMMRALRRMQTHIQSNFEHVGRRFPEEARKMHLGESEKRSIYGEATASEAKELRDEGIEVQQVPWLPRHDA